MISGSSSPVPGTAPVIRPRTRRRSATCISITGADSSSTRISAYVFRRWSMKAACSGYGWITWYSAIRSDIPSSPNSSLACANATPEATTAFDGAIPGFTRIGAVAGHAATAGDLFGKPIVQLPAEHGGRRPAGRIFHEPGLTHLRLKRSRNDVLARVADARRRSQHHGNAEPLGEVEAGRHERHRLRGRGRVEDRHLRHHRQQPAVLLRLRGVGTRVVRAYDQEPARHPDVGGAEQRIGGDVQPHLLHADRGSQPGDGGSVRDLERDLFVHRPFDVHRCAAFFPPAIDRGEDLGGGRPRIGSGDRAAGLDQPARDGVVPLHKNAFAHEENSRRSISRGPTGRGRSSTERSSG